MRYTMIFGEIPYKDLRARLIGSAKKRLSGTSLVDIEEYVDAAIAAVIERAAVGRFKYRNVAGLIAFLSKAVIRLAIRASGRSRRIRCDTEQVEHVAGNTSAREHVSAPSWLNKATFSSDGWVALQLLTYRISLEDIDAVLLSNAYRQDLRKLAYRFGKVRAQHGKLPFRDWLESPLIPRHVADRIRVDVKRLRRRVLLELRRRSANDTSRLQPPNGARDDPIQRLQDEVLFAVFVSLTELIETANRHPPLYRPTPGNFSRKIVFL